MDDLTRISHVGVVVPDLDRARVDLSAALGLTWAPVSEQTVVARGAGGLIRTPVSLTWSREGPPHVELLQAAEGTPWAAGGARTLHHVGYWVDDVRGSAERLERSGHVLELSGVDSSGEELCDFAYLLRDGLRIEVLDVRRRRMLERWFQLGAS